MIQTEEQIEFLTAEEARAISQHSELLNILHNVKKAALKGYTSLVIENWNRLSDKTKLDLTELGYKFGKSETNSGRASTVCPPTVYVTYYITWKE